MSNFLPFREAIKAQMDLMISSQLFKTDVSKDDLWTTYINSFPEGTNPIYKTRTEYDCQCCKQFIRVAGNVVAIKNNKLISIWDIEVGGHFQTVADAMAELVKAAAIRHIFMSPEAKLGTESNKQMLNDGSVTTWNHFHYNLPSTYVKRGELIGPHISDTNATKQVFQRGLNELTMDAMDTVLELIGQNSLYRGEEHKSVVSEFRKMKVKYDKVKPELQDNFCWDNFKSTGTRIRNTAIGTLLQDLSEGMDLNTAVGIFEAIVAPSNYKRPTALITKSMIQDAQKKVKELGIETALQRRHSVLDDITINNVLYADRSVKEALDVFDELAEEVPDNPKSLDKVEEVDIETFIRDIIPQASNIEVMLENRHESNLMSLISPADPTAKNILSWGNNFSWTYNGEVTDSIKERVKQAGGRVTGYLRNSLSWFNFDDLDLHMIEPGNNEIYYGNKQSNTGGNLDVDMNAGGRNTRTPVENIIYPTKGKMKEGQYVLTVHNFSKRENTDVGFDVEIEFGNKIHTFHYDKAVRDNKTIEVATLEYTKKDGLKIIKSLPSTTASREVWGLNTHKFHKVSAIMNSPNHWDDQQIGNKHIFFMLEGCVNNEPVRGLFNEFLSSELNKHRKVFEMLGSKLKVEPTDNELSGIGFSTTQRNHILCKVTGNFSRTIKVTF